MIAPAMNKQQLDADLAQLPFLELLAEARLLEKPTVTCLMDTLIGKQQPQPDAHHDQDHRLTSLIVTERSLPPILRNWNDGDRLKVKRSSPAYSLIANWRYLPIVRVVRLGGAKIIKHKGRICEVTETHDQLRRLLPLINKDLSLSKAPPFWGPRRVADKKQTTAERIRRQYANGLRVTFRSPLYTGEPRPEGARRVQLYSHYPSPGYLTHLVKDLGYNGRAAFAAVARGHLPQLQIDRCGWRYSPQAGKFVKNLGVGIHPEHPYVAAAANRELTVGGGYRKEQVTAAIGKHRWDDKHATAVYEVVYLGREPRLVSLSMGLKLLTVYQYCHQVRADLGKSKTYTNLGQVYTNLRPQICVFKLLSPLFLVRAYRF